MRHRERQRRETPSTDDRLLFGITYAQGIALAFVAGGVVVMMLRSRVGDGRLGIYETARQ